VPEKIAEHLPDVRLIYIVCHPLEWIEPQWMYNVRRNKVHQPFARTLLDDQHIINTSRYWWQLCKYREIFDDACIRVLFFNDLKQEPHAVLRDCFDFLGVNPDEFKGDATEQRNVTTSFDLQGRALSKAGKIPGFHILKEHLPASLKKGLRPLLKQQVSGHTQWDPGIRQQVIEALQADTSRLLEYCNKPGDYWDLAGIASQQGKHRQIPMA
jgi:hypothetical protein